MGQHMRVALSSNKDSDEPAQMRRLARVFAARIHRFSGGGGTLKFVYIRRFVVFFCFFFFGSIFEFQYFWGFHKTEYFLGMKILWIFFWGHHKIGLYLAVIFMHFSLFSKRQGT